MIYLFEDRPERLKQNKRTLLRYQNLIKHEVLTICSGEKKSSDSLFPNAKLIIIHSSYRFPGDKCTLNDAIRVFKGLPIVVFSGQIQQSSKSIAENVYRVNSIIMYDNLPEFLDAKEKGENPPIEMLLWGKNYKKNQLLNVLYDIARYSLEKKLDDAIDDDTSLTIEETIETHLQAESMAIYRNRLVELLNNQLGALTYEYLIIEIEKLMRILNEKDIDISL